MTRAPPTKLSVEKYFRLWKFHEMFMNLIKNMGWLTSLVVTESGTDYNIAKDFGEFKIETIKTEYQALELSTSPNDNTKKLEYRVVYNWIFKSRCELSQYFFAKESENYHRSGPLAWKLITTKILRGIKQGLCRAQSMIHTFSLEKFDKNTKSLVKYLKGNRNLLKPCGESESSILANLLQVLKKSPSSYLTVTSDNFRKNTTMAQTLV